MNEFLNKIMQEHNQKFSGRLRLLHPKDSRELGFVELQKGEVTNGKFVDRNGYNAILSATMAYMDQPFKMVLEPESDFGETEIKVPSSKILSNLTKASVYYSEKQKLKPPMGLKMAVNPEFLLNGQVIQNHEFDLLCAISDFGVAKDIYAHSNLFDHEITLGLIKLREKKAIKVVR